ncbi:uroporphyrinogen-III synthase [Sphingomonas donggukensis]|uniref:Uroporphyrinogen-III synthase n=1 Tax=Sphingomonas donggukensis TaxID=2949093 RepID=A0ABY4TTI7_9SPHN|nr:uroporphyrinogen-III synthase [Sphingomonas donggukensis]URW75719.1 uroporphyrinogen-III synthase [Sphingomonas donggukensis]
MTRVGVLRPEPGNAATAARLIAAGLTPVRLPLFEVRACDWTPPDPAQFDALLVTSANAIRHGGAGLAALHSLPVRAVGEATATAARAAGFRVESVGTGGVADVPRHGRLLHLAGREHHALPGVETVVVYASDPLTPDLAPLAGAIALVHSPRAAARLAALVTARATITLAAISPAAAAAAGTGWRHVAVAARPSDAALVALAAVLHD